VRSVDRQQCKVTMSRKSFLADTFYNALATVAVSLGALGVSVVCARSYGADTLGKYSFALSLVVPVFLMGGFNLRQLTSSYPDSVYDSKEFSRVQLIGLAGAMVLCSFFALGVWGASSSGREVALIVLCVALIKCIDTAADGRFGHLARTKQFKTVAARRIQRAVLTTLVFSLCTFLATSFLLSLLSMAAVSGALLAMHNNLCFRGWRSAVERFSWPSARILRVAVVSGAAASVDSLSAMLPRIALGAANSYSELGYYTAAMQIPLLFAVMVGALGNAAIPRWRVEKSRNEVIKSFLAIQGLVAVMAASLYLLSVHLGDWLLVFFYGNSFQSVGWVLRSVVVGSAFWFFAGINGCALQGLASYRWLLAANLGSLVTVLLGLCICYASEGGVSLAMVVNIYIVSMFMRLVVSTIGLVRSI